MKDLRPGNASEAAYQRVGTQRIVQIAYFCYCVGGACRCELPIKDTVSLRCRLHRASERAVA